MSDGVRVRTARPEDAERLYALEVSIEGAPHWSQPAWRQMLTARTPLEDAERAVWVAEQAERVIGFIVGGRVREIAEIESIAVAPEMRGRGVARAMLGELIEWARTRDAEELVLEVRESNVPARSLYASAGFQEQGRRPRYYHSPAEDALLLGLRLRPSLEAK